MDGLQRMLNLTSFLSDQGIHYQIVHTQRECLLVSATIVGARLEFDCFADRITYRYFAGSEAVSPGEEELLGLL